MNNTETHAAIKNKQSIHLNFKRTGNFNKQIPIPLQRKENPSSISPQTTPFDFIDFYEIKGQYEARRVMEIAAAAFPLPPYLE
jgi:predicted ATPase with chaperone activity